MCASPRPPERGELLLFPAARLCEIAFRGVTLLRHMHRPPPLHVHLFSSGKQRWQPRLSAAHGEGAWAQSAWSRHQPRGPLGYRAPSPPARAVPGEPEPPKQGPACRSMSLTAWHPAPAAGRTRSPGHERTGLRGMRLRRRFRASLHASVLWWPCPRGRPGPGQGLPAVPVRLSIHCARPHAGGCQQPGQGAARQEEPARGREGGSCCLCPRSALAALPDGKPEIDFLQSNSIITNPN